MTFVEMPRKRKRARETNRKQSHLYTYTIARKKSAPEENFDRVKKTAHGKSIFKKTSVKITVVTAVQ